MNSGGAVGILFTRQKIKKNKRRCRKEDQSPAPLTSIQFALWNALSGHSTLLRLETTPKADIEFGNFRGIRGNWGQIRCGDTRGQCASGYNWA